MAEIHELYAGEVEVHFYQGKHWYKVRGGPGLLVPNDHKLHYGPSVSSITNQKSKPLTGWAARETARYLDERKDELVNHVLEYEGLDEAYWAELLREATNEHRRAMRRAGDVGSVVHAWIERFVQAQIQSRKKGTKFRSPPLPKNKQAARGARRFKKWVEDARPRFLWTERVLYSRAHHYFGTADTAFTLPKQKGVFIGDFKTSKDIYLDHALQEAGYVNAYLEEFPDTEIAGRYLIHISKQTGSVQPILVEEYSGNFEGQDWESDFAAFLGLRAVYFREKGI